MSSGFRFIYTGIRVKNMEESLKFYTEVLGMIIAEPLEEHAPTRGRVVTLRSPNSDQLLELNHYQGESPFNFPFTNGEDLDHLAFDVQDLETTVKALRQQGVEVIVEPYAIGGWREAFVRDPNGIWIEVLKRK